MNSGAVGLPDRFYVLAENTGTFDVVTVQRTPLTNVDSVLKTLVQDTPFLVPRIAFLNKEYVHCQMSGKMLTLFVKIPFLNLDTFWILRKPEGDGETRPFIVPIFIANDLSFRVSPKWVPPADQMAIFFMVHYVPGTDSAWRYSHASVVLISLLKDVKDHFKIPLPNIYTNGKICMGGSGEALALDTKMPVLENFSAALEVFQKATWNADLLRDNSRESIERIFRLDASDNKTQLPVPKDWYKLCMKISNQEFIAIPFHSLV